MERLSVLPVSFFPDFAVGRMTIVDWARMAKGIGLAYVDLPNWVFRCHQPVYLGRLKTELDILGISIAMVGTYSDFTNPDALQRRRELDYLRRDIALASQMGARLLRVTDGQAHPGTGLEQGINWAVEGLTEAAATAVDYGMQLVFENHGQPGGWVYDDFSHNVEVFLEIAMRLDGTGIGINFDNGNATGCGWDAVELLKRVLGNVVSVHISDTGSRATTLHTALGAGASPIRGVLELLKSSGFDGWICIEEDSGRGVDGIYQAVTQVRGIWNSLPEWKG